MDQHHISFSVFTKPWKTPLPDLARLVRGLGFDGVELPVRPGYQVLPENVRRDTAGRCQAPGRARAADIQRGAAGRVARRAARRTVHRSLRRSRRAGHPRWPRSEMTATWRA